MPKNHLLSSISAQEGSAATCETHTSVQKLSLKMSAFFAAICLLAAALFALAPGNLAYAAEYQDPDNADVTYTYTEEDGTAHITGITTTNDVTEAKIPGTIEINGTEGTTFLPVARVTFAQGVSTITSLDLSACSDLTSFYCASSTLEAAKFQGTGKLTSIEFITPAGNLSSLDLVGCSELTNQFHARFFRKLTKQTITKNQFKGVLFDTPLFFHPFGKQEKRAFLTNF